MRHDDQRISRRRSLEKRRYPPHQHGIAFALRGRDVPSVIQPPPPSFFIACSDFTKGQPVPFAPGYFLEAIVKDKSICRYAKAPTDDFRGSPSPGKRTRNNCSSIAIPDRVMQPAADGDRLSFATIGKRRVAMALHAASAVPLGFAVPNKVYGSDHSASPCSIARHTAIAWTLAATS